MLRKDFQRLITGPAREPRSAYVGVLLSSGLGCAGLWFPTLNGGLEETCLLANARLFPIQAAGPEEAVSTTVTQFHAALEDLGLNALDVLEEPTDFELSTPAGNVGNIPLFAISLPEVIAVYPLAYIKALLPKLVGDRGAGVTNSFREFDNPFVVSQLERIRLW